jgi:hypothetical protein
MDLLPFDVNSNRQLFNNLKSHTNRLRRQKRYKELLRDYFIFWCFFTIYQMRQRNEISRGQYVSYVLDFVRYCSIRSLNFY